MGIFATIWIYSSMRKSSGIYNHAATTLRMARQKGDLKKNNKLQERLVLESTDIWVLFK